ncbi:pentapeptide repeat-containing protein [Mucilaginibacter sp. NFX135]|uniref:pentapeptide repeat-containing protein n=1 Tax=Mucilaginibacter sp. NFX135 TaxID=3402687 RepID=UPI003AFB557A
MFANFSIEKTFNSIGFSHFKYILLFLFFIGNSVSAKQLTSKTDTIFIKKSTTPFDSLHLVNRQIAIINDKPYDELNKSKSYNGAIFRKGVIFSNSKFKNGIPCQSSQPIYLAKSLFVKPVNLDSSKFLNIADFNMSDFADTISFVGARFDSTAIFSNCIFRGFANFTRVNFSKMLFFNFLNLKEKATFSFYQSELPDLLDLSRNPLITNKIDLTTCNFDHNKQYEYSSRKWHYINLYASDISKIKIDYVHFRLCFYKNFYLPDKKLVFDKNHKDVLIIEKDTIANKSILYHNSYFKAYIKKVFPQSDLFSDESFLGTIFSFLKFKGNPVIDEFVNECYRRRRFPQSLSDEEIYSIYEKELKVFDTEGQRTSYRNMDIEYKNLNNDFKIITHVWNCYGYHKEWVIYWMLLFLLVFTIITFFKLKTLISAFDMPVLFLEKKRKKEAPVIIVTEETVNSLNLADKLLYAFVFTASIFFPFKFEFSSLKWNTWWVIYLFIIYLSGIFCIGYLAAFILQK